MSLDPFQSIADCTTASARAPFAVLPHDTNEIAIVPKALYVGTGGQLTLRGIGGSTDVVFKNVANGQILDVRAQFVRATGTTASDIVALA